MHTSITHFTSPITTFPSWQGVSIPRISYGYSFQVLHETLKTLEKREISNSKLLQENFEFLLSKDKLIKYLLETQTTILNLVISVKNQEKTQDKM